MKYEFIIRFSEIEDLPFIVDIYNQAIKSETVTGDTKEFCVEDRIEWYNKFNNNKYPIYVTEVSNKIVGYCTLSPYRPGRKAMSTVAEISYYLDYSFHRKGIGTALLQHAISDCKRIGTENLIAILFDTNFPSIKLLEKLNFKKWGHFPNIIKLNGNKYGHLIYGLKI